jgi:hypothetical protein
MENQTKQPLSEYVQQSWDKVVAAKYNAMMTLHIKWMCTTKALTIWAQRLIPQGKLAAAICREIIG